MALINGSQGIGTGYSTNIPNFSVSVVIANMRRLIAGEEIVDMYPSYRKVYYYTLV